MATEHVKRCMFVGIALEILYAQENDCMVFYHWSRFGRCWQRDQWSRHGCFHEKCDTYGCCIDRHWCHSAPRLLDWCAGCHRETKSLGLVRAGISIEWDR